MPRLRPLLLTLISVCLTLAVLSGPAQAAGSPNISLSAGNTGTVLLGGDETVTLTASNPVGQGRGYNLTFKDVLPAGVSYVAGSATVNGESVSARTINNAPAVGQTTVLFENVSDIAAGSSVALTYKVRPTPAAPGSTYQHNAAAYVNSDPRYLPKFNATTGAVIAGSTSYTGDASATKTTTQTAIDVSRSEPSAEGELLRGAHNHQTVYTFDVTNNAVAQTTGTTATVYLPANLEFLGCGQADNTTNAAGTNFGSTQEFPGAGSLAGRLPAPANCAAPTSVDVIGGDPDGPGAMTSGYYTRVTYDVGTLTPGQTRTFRYVAAIPIRANTATWSGATPTAASGQQGANLDNNNGAESSDEQQLPTFTTAAGSYNGTTAVTDDDILTRTAEDVQVFKSASPGTFIQGQLTRWTLTVKTSEYRYANNIRVTDVLPDGVCPLDTSNREGTAECAPVAGQNPSDTYTSVTENANGSWQLTWDQSTVPALAQMGPSATKTIAFTSKVRENYQENSADALPVAGRDGLTNNVSVAGADYARCSDTGDAVCDNVFSTRIYTTEPNGTDDTDASSASLSSTGPTIDKKVRENTGTVSTAVDCNTGTFLDTAASGYGPGDRVCFRLRVNFPAGLDTKNAEVSDFLPAGLTNESWYATANDTIPAGQRTANFTAGSNTSTFTLGDTNGYVDQGRVFEVMLVARVTDPNAAATGDITENLMKFAYSNSAGAAQAQRDSASATWSEANLTLTEGIQSVGGLPAGGNPANTDSVLAQSGQTATVRVDVTNSSASARTATAAVRENLPSQVTCAAVSNISDGGTCSSGVITWTGVSVAAAATKKLTYDYIIPSGTAPNTTFNHTAGVTSYTTTSNTGATYTYYPASNIDTSLESQANTTAAKDTTSTRTAAPTVTNAVTSAINDSAGQGNGNAELAIGERVNWTYYVTIPEGTTLAGSTYFNIPGSNRQSIIPGTASATLNSTALPTSGLTLSQTGDGVRVDFPNPYTNATGSGNDLLAITFSAYLDDETTNHRQTAANYTLQMPGTLNYNNAVGAQTATTTPAATVVEPSVTLTKSHSPAPTRVTPGQTLTYTLTFGNVGTTRQSAAYDSTVVDTLPVGLTPLDGSGNPVADGGTAAGTGGGVWNATARTLTFTRTAALRNASTAFTYSVKVADPQAANSQLTNTATVRTTSVPETITHGPERSAASTRTTGYTATATDTINLVNASVAKSVNKPTVTVGDKLIYSVDVTVPGGVGLNDVTVRDALPDGIDYDGLLDAECVSACSPAVSATELPAQSNVDGSTTAGFFLGDVAAAPTGQDRVLRIRYNAHVDDRYEPEATLLARGNALTNSAVVHSNRTNVIAGVPGSIPTAGSFSDASAASTATTTVTEPTLTIDKDVSGDADDDDLRTTQPGDSYTYTVKVTNTGNSEAHNVVVSDQPDTDLTNVSEGTLPADVTSTDSWTAGDPRMEWYIESIPAGATRTITYTADLRPSSTLTSASVVTNTADVDEYFGVSAGERLGNPTIDYRRYTDTVADTVSLDADLPMVTTQLKADDSTENGPARINQSFTWRGTLTNTSTATAKNASLVFTLPVNWTYVAGSATGLGSGALTTSTSGGVQTLTVTGIGDIAPSAVRNVTFAARPAVAARTNPGTASAANTADLKTTWSDTSAAALASYTSNDGAAATLQVPTLTISKTPDGAASTAGTARNWTITVVNTGNAPANDVVVNDSLPADISYTAGTATVDIGTLNETDGVGPDLSFTIPSIAAGASRTITLPTALAASTPNGANRVNTASASATEHPASVSDTGSVAVNTRADVAVTKTADAASVVAGTSLGYTLKTTNNGPSDAQTVTTTDPLPAGTSFASFTSNPGDACGHTAGVITCNYGVLTPAAERTVEFRVNTASSVTSTFTNTATATTSTTDPVPANNSASRATTVTRSADLKLDKTRTSAAITRQSENATFDLKVTNDGPSDATSVTITDPLPTGATFVSGAGCSAAAGNITCNIGALAAGADATRAVTLKMNTVGTITNTASVSGAQSDPTPANNSDSDQVQVTPTTDVALTKSAPATARPGDDFSYTLSARNNGPSAAPDAEVTDTLPAGVTFRSLAAPAGWSCTTPAVGADGAITCTRSSLPANATADFTLTVRAGAGVADSTVTNTAAVSTTGDELVTTNNSGSASTNLGPASDIAIENTPERTTYLQGQVIRFNQKVTNNGPSDATDATITQQVPAGTTFNAGASTAGWTESSPGVYTLNVGDLAKGADRTVMFAVTAVAVGTPESRPSVDAVEPDLNLANNEDPASVTVNPTVDLGVDKTGPATTTAGGNATFNLKVTNNGPSDATGVTVADTLPTGLTLVSANPDQGSCTAGTPTNGVTCALGAIATGDSVDVTVVAKAAFAAAEQTLTNSATVDANEDELPATAANDTDTAATTVGPAADLRIAKTASNATPSQKNTFAYTLTATNDGPSTATDVEIADALPAGVEFVSVAPSSPTCDETSGTVTCDFGSVAKDDSVSATITVRAADVGLRTNTATVSSTTPDPDPANNTGAADIVIGPTADLSIVKTAPATVAANGELTYKLKVHNAGPSKATNARITDNLPAGVGFIDATSADAACNAAAGAITCQANGDLASGADLTVDVRARATFATAATSVLNTASVTADEHDTDLSDNVSTAATSVGSAADVQVVKSGPASAPANTNTSYVLVVRNNGGQTATGVSLRDAVPTGMTATSVTTSQGNCSATDQSVGCALGTLTAGASAQVTVGVRIARGIAGQSLTNTATVTGDQPDPNQGNNSSQVTTRIVPPSDTGGGSLRVSKVAASPTVKLGRGVAYTITVTNQTALPATGVTAIDTPSLPVRVLYIKPSQGTCKGLKCELGTIAPGAKATIKLAMEPLRPGTIVNNVSVFSNQGDRDVTDDTDQAQVKALLARTDIALTKKASRKRVRAGGSLTYRIRVRNRGSSTAANVRVCDILPRGMTFRSAKGARYSKGRACWTIKYLRPRATKTYRVKVRINHKAGGRLVNRATVNSRNAGRRTAKAPIKAVSPRRARGGGVTG